MLLKEKIILGMATCSSKKDKHGWYVMVNCSSGWNGYIKIYFPGGSPMIIQKNRHYRFQGNFVERKVTSFFFFTSTETQFETTMWNNEDFGKGESEDE